MPAEFLVLSLAPWIRYKEDNILMSMLVPSTLSAVSQLKFFKKVIQVELNDLVLTGLITPYGNIKVKVFGQASSHIMMCLLVT